jgi:hypothetical protein
MIPFRLPSGHVPPAALAMRCWSPHSTRHPHTFGGGFAGSTGTPCVTGRQPNDSFTGQCRMGTQPSTPSQLQSK